MSEKLAPQRPISTWQFVKCPSWSSFSNTSMNLNILFLEFQLYHCYFICLLNHQVLQQSKANLTELQNQPLVTARHGLDKNTLRCGIFSSNLIICFFMLHVFLMLWGNPFLKIKFHQIKTRNNVVLLIFYELCKFWFSLFFTKKLFFLLC